MTINTSDILISKGFKCPYCGYMMGIIRLHPYIITTGIIFKKHFQIIECQCAVCKQHWQIKKREV